MPVSASFSLPLLHTPFKGYSMHIRVLCPAARAFHAHSCALLSWCGFSRALPSWYGSSATWAAPSCSVSHGNCPDPELWCETWTASTLKPVSSLNDDDLVHNICVFLFNLWLQRNISIIVITVGDLLLWQIHQEEMQYSHPGMAITVAHEVARLKQLPLEEVLAACYQNSINMYGMHP